MIASISGSGRGAAGADRLCDACVEWLHVDGAALSVVYDGSLSRALGSSGPVSRELIEMQFALGEGPCVDVADASLATTGFLFGPDAARWPAFARDASQLGVRVLFVLPVSVVGTAIGTLCLHRDRAEPFDAAATDSCFLAAELAAMPLLDLIAIDLNTPIDDDRSNAWEGLAALTRSEVYQAAGVLMVQLDLSPAEAMVRLRGHAFAYGKTPSEVAYDILEHDLHLDNDEHR